MCTCIILYNENWVTLIKIIIRTDVSKMLLAAMEALLAGDGFSVNCTLSENSVTSAPCFIVGVMLKAPCLKM